MRKDRNFGILLLTTVVLTGTFLPHESSIQSRWCIGIQPVARTATSAVGPMTMCWAIQPHLSIGRLEQHVRRHR